MAVDDDEYELLPKQEIENLKKDIERLKKHPFGEMKEGETLLEAVNNLNNNIRRLIDIFAKAEADIAAQYAEGNPAEDLKSIKEQNEEIAQGLLTAVDMIKDMKSENTSISPGQKIAMTRPSFDNETQQYQELPDEYQQIPPPPQPFPGLQSNQMPPPMNNPFDKKRKGMFSRK